jgi:hypothetical protein
MAVAIAIAIAISVAVDNSVTIAITVTIAHRCRRCHQPLPLLLPLTIAKPSLPRCHQPFLSPLPLLSAIAVSITVGHSSCHRRRKSPLPCCWPFLRVVALVWQKLYSTN